MKARAVQRHVKRRSRRSWIEAHRFRAKLDATVVRPQEEMCLRAERLGDRDLELDGSLRARIDDAHVLGSNTDRDLVRQRAAWAWKEERPRDETALPGARIEEVHA